MRALAQRAMRLSRGAVWALALWAGAAQAQYESPTTADLDRQVIAPTGAIPIPAWVEGAQGAWQKVDWVLITVNDVTHQATVPPGAWHGYILWDSSQKLNPSEHFVHATAQISRDNGAETLHLDSRRLPWWQGGERPYGDGRRSNFVIADLRFKELKFKGGGNIPLRWDADTPVHTPQAEWGALEGAAAREEPAAYVRNSNVTVEFSLHPFNGDADLAGFSLSLSAMRKDGQGALTLYHSQQPEAFGERGTAERTSQTALLNMVAEYEAYVSLVPRVKFTLAGGWGEATQVISEFSATHRLFATHSAPVSPMEEPWVGVLHYGCSWACGENTDALVAKKITTGLFFAQILAYPYGSPGFPSHWMGTNLCGNCKVAFDPNCVVEGCRVPVFKLARFLDRLQTQQPVSGNCFDVSSFHMIVACALGLDFSVQILVQDEPKPEKAFTSNPFCPIGSDPTDDGTYMSLTWDQHQISTRTGAVYDPTGAHKRDLSGAGYRNPPINWDLGPYWQTADPDPGHGDSGWLGLVMDGDPSTPEPELEASSPYVRAAYKVLVR